MNCFVAFRQKTNDLIIDVVEYSSKFAEYSTSDYVNTLLDNFARHLFVWRKPYPKFRQGGVSTVLHFLPCILPYVAS